MTRKKVEDRMESVTQPEIAPWETGCPNGRGVYERRGRYASHLYYLGMMESPELARHVVSLHNSLTHKPVLDVP